MTDPATPTAEADCQHEHAVYWRERAKATESYLALARAEGYRAGIEQAANLHESINNECDMDRNITPAEQVRRGLCGCGAMGAVIEYRDSIRALLTEPSGGAK